MIINGKQSEIRLVKLGVPQGSILCPLLFSMYINDLPQFLGRSQILMYADDITIYFPARNSQDLNIALQNDVDRVADWLNSKKFCLNTNKTKLLLIGNSHRLSDFQDILTATRQSSGTY